MGDRSIPIVAVQVAGRGFQGLCGQIRIGYVGDGSGFCYVRLNGVAGSDGPVHGGFEVERMWTLFG
ncbi:MAG: hypothetical protein NVS2B7_10660 [Herpetosiphon sp.]